MAGASKPRNSQASSGRASQKKTHPKQPKSTLSRAAPQSAYLRTQKSRSPTPAPPFAPMDEFELAPQMREISGGPIAASFDIPQPFNVLNDRVPSRTQLLAHAQQAQDIGVYAIQRGQKVPASSPGGESVMASPPPPHPPTTGIQDHGAIQGGFQPHNMQRSFSMPAIHMQNNHYGATGPQNMTMNRPQQYQVGPAYNGLPGMPSVGSHNPQFQGNPQHIPLQQGHSGGMPPNGGANMGFNGNMGMNLGQPFGHHPYSGMPPPPNLQYMQHQGATFNYGPAGAFGGVMPPNMPFNMQMYPGQVANPVHNGRQLTRPSPMQRSASRMSNIDPQLANASQFMATPVIDQQAPMAFINGARPPTRNGVITTTQPNQTQRAMAQQIQNGANAIPRVSHSGNAMTQKTLNGPMTATQPSDAPHVMGQQAQIKPTTIPQINNPSNSITQETQNQPTVTPQQNNTLQSIAQAGQNGASATPRATGPQSAVAPEPHNGLIATPQVKATINSDSLGIRTGTYLQSSPSKCPVPPPAPEAPGRVTITLTCPVFDKAFMFPSSNDGWNALFMEQSTMSGEKYPERIHSKVSNGNFEVILVNPTFKEGCVWEQPLKASSIPDNETKSSPPGVEMDRDVLVASKQSDGQGAPHSSGCSALPNKAATPSTLRKGPVAGPAQRKPNQTPKTPPMATPPSLANQTSPSVSPLSLTEREAASTPAPQISVERPRIEPRRPDTLPRPPPQLLESHKKKTHNRPTVKRAAPATEQEVSPPKRHKTSPQNSPTTSAQNPSTRSVPSESLAPTTTKVGFDGRLDFAPPLFPSIEQAKFAKKVAELPTLKPCQINPSDHHKARCQSQSRAPSQSFNPTPSQPIKNSGLFISPEEQNKRKKYSAAVAQQQKEQQNPGLQDRAPLKSMKDRGSTARTPSDMPALPQTHDGLPAQEQSQARQNQGSLNVANSYRELEYQHPATLLDGDAANTAQQQEDYDFEFMINTDQFDIDDFLDMNGNPESTGQLSGNDLREKRPDTGSSGNSNSEPSPQTPTQAESYPPGYSPLDQFYMADSGHLGDGYNRAWGSGSGAVPSGDEVPFGRYQSTGGEFSDIVTVGNNMRVKKGSLMAEFGKNLHS